MKAKSHIVHMSTRTDANEQFISVARCDCRWRFEVPFYGDRQKQEDAIQAHWNEVGFKPEIS